MSIYQLLLDKVLDYAFSEDSACIVCLTQV